MNAKGDSQDPQPRCRRGLLPLLTVALLCVACASTGTRYVKVVERWGFAPESESHYVQLSEALPEIRKQFRRATLRWGGREWRYDGCRISMQGARKSSTDGTHWVATNPIRKLKSLGFRSGTEVVWIPVYSDSDLYHLLALATGRRATSLRDEPTETFLSFMDSLLNRATHR